MFPCDAARSMIVHAAEVGNCIRILPFSFEDRGNSHDACHWATWFL